MKLHGHSLNFSTMSSKMNSPSKTLITSPYSSWSYLSAITLGLLSSSCCIIQLVLNAFSIGCAGFSVLTPYRPVFSSISLLLIIYVIYKYRFSKRTAITMGITLLLSTSPELVSVHNRSALEPYYGDLFLVKPIQPIFQLFRQLPINAGNNIFETEDTKQNKKAGGLTATPLIKYDVHVDGMACEACGSRLRQHFSSRKDVEKVNVYFEEKRIEIWSKSGLGSMVFSEQSIQAIIAEIDSKYSARVVGVYSETE